MELELEPWNLTASQVCPKSMGEHPVGLGGAPSTGTSGQKDAVGQECSKEGHTLGPRGRSPARLPCSVGFPEGQSRQLATCPLVLLNRESCHCSPGESRRDLEASILLPL